MFYLRIYFTLDVYGRRICSNVEVKMFGKVSRVFNSVNEFSMKYPVVRGMVSYGTIWPTGCFLQQIVAGDEKFDYSRAARFSFFGCFYVAPTINTWLTIARTIWPKNDIKSAVIKVQNLLSLFIID